MRVYACVRVCWWVRVRAEGGNLDADPSNCLNKTLVAPQEALLVCVENGHQRHLHIGKDANY